MSDLSLIEAVKAGDQNRAKTLLKEGADVNQGDEQGWTPLNFAAGKGDLEMVQLLVESGADVFRTGRDKRTPYMIALAAGRVSAATYLKQVEDNSEGPKPQRPERPYSRAYCLGELRAYPNWREQRLNWIEREGETGSNEVLADDKIVFIHQDLSVTESMWHNENVLFQGDEGHWREFCERTLKFKPLDDFDLMVLTES